MKRDKDEQNTEKRQKAQRTEKKRKIGKQKEEDK